jgi:uncharacterized repeat protein (TIGR03803 family)
MQYKLYGLTIVTLSACSAPPPEVGIAADGLTAGLTVLHTFGAGEGNAPRGALAEVNGRLYGLNGEGGPNATANCNSTANWNTDEHIKRCPGSLFSLALDGSDFRIEHAFTQLDGNRRNLDGYHPYGSLAVGPDGTLYGVTQTGGAPPAGVDPDQPLISGYGVLFSFNPATHAFTTLHTFFSVPRALDGAFPMGLTAVDADGNVYGTAKGGGTTSTGTVWRYSPGGGFVASPLPGETYGGVALAQGLLHGTTWARGANAVGDYFTVNTSTMAVTVVASFPGYTANDHGTDNTPIQAPTALSGGAILASREFGGAHGTGLVVRLSPSSGITVLHDSDDIPVDAVPRFANATGGMLNGGLVEGRDGLVYGMAQYGGANGTGGIYRIARDGSLFQLLFSFPNSAYPYGGLLLGSDGAFYGMEFGAGVVFRFVPQTVACP